MSYWSENPELYDEIIVDEAIRKGIVREEEREEKTEAGYWGNRIDDAMMRREGK